VTHPKGYPPVHLVAGTLEIGTEKGEKKTGAEGEGGKR
jgi:hypothetical protein